MLVFDIAVGHALVGRWLQIGPYDRIWPPNVANCSRFVDRRAALLLHSTAGGTHVGV